MTLALEVDLPADLARFQLPEAVAARLQTLLNRQDSGQPLTPQERAEAEGLDPEEFLKLRTALDHVEEQLWDQELDRVSAKHRNAKLTDAKIDELVLKRRYKGRKS